MESEVKTDTASAESAFEILGGGLRAYRLIVLARALLVERDALQRRVARVEAVCDAVEAQHVLHMTTQMGVSRERVFPEDGLVASKQIRAALAEEKS